MNLDRKECAAIEIPRTLSGTTQASLSPAQENLNIVLDHAMVNADTALRYVGKMITHITVTMHSPERVKLER